MSDQYKAVLPNYTVWDQTPILNSEGEPVVLLGRELWLFLCAPECLKGDDRHFKNRLRLAFRDGDQWLDGGFLLPDGFSPGTREWAGIAYLEGPQLNLYYTATGIRNSSDKPFLQRVFKASGTLLIEGSNIGFTNWSDDGEQLQPDSRWYDDSHLSARFKHAIKAFRDPYLFSDKNTMDKCMLVAATTVEAELAFDACIALAAKNSENDEWRMLAPILNAEGVTYEVERPHCISYKNRTYVFWSVHGWTTAQHHSLPTGLYGMVADSLVGPFELLNGNGLVACNPTAQPYQAYSWFVTKSLMVSSFIDLPNGQLMDHAGFLKPSGRFIGAVAPEFKLELDGARACPIFSERIN